MQIDWNTLFRDYYTENWTPVNNRGWTHVRCPFCDDSGRHGGFHVSGAYSCFRCGRKRIAEAVAKLLKYPVRDIWPLLKRYGAYEIVSKDEKKLADEIKLPDSYKIKGTQAEIYLRRRNFDPEKIESEYGVRIASLWGRWNYRIMIPIFKDGKMISYMGRDYTDKSPTRYMACPMEEEAFHYKWSCYGIDNVKKNMAVLVEGITDQWRLGDNSVALYGTGFTKAQVLAIVKKIDKAFILFDPDDAGQLASEKLQRELENYNVDSEILVDTSGKDPGDYTDMEALEIMKELKLRR